VRLLAHSLDFWLPHVDEAARELALSVDRCAHDEKTRAKLNDIESDPTDEFTIERPRYGATLWSGEDEAWEVTKRVVELADRRGQLRGLLDAVRSHRVQDDFSPLWSYAKEDFERKLYSKRSKVKVSFVELDDTIPIHGPDSEVHDNLIWQDLMTLVDEKDRRVVVCLRNGITKRSEISTMLGYANHSPISKALARIQRKAKLLFGS
jgi:hypothetical protein